MNDYEKYLCCNILLDAISKYQANCMDRRKALKLQLYEYNLANLQDTAAKTAITTAITTVETALASITTTLSDLSAKRAGLLNTMQGQGGLGLAHTIDFTSLQY